MSRLVAVLAFLRNDRRIAVYFHSSIRSAVTMTGDTLPSFNVNYRSYTPEMISTPTAAIIEKVRQQMDKVAAIPDDEMTCQSVIGGLADIDAELDTFTGYMARLPANAATDKSVRDAASDAEKTLQKFNVELAMRKDIFDKVVALSEKTDLQAEHPQMRRFIEKRIQKGRRNGLHLDQETRNKLQGMQNRITETTIEYLKNCSEDDTWLAFSEEELVGLPESFISGLERTDDGLCKVTVLAPHFIVLRRCSNPETRRKLTEARASKCIKTNTPLIEEFVGLFHRHAQLLGFDTNAHYKTDIKMSHSPTAVRSFLAELRDRLQPLWDDERRLFLEYKREECARLSVPFDDCVQLWDVPYYSALVESRRYAVDQEMLRDYFPVDRVTTGLLDIYQRLLGLRFSRVPDASVWHDEVQLYAVHEASGAHDDGRLVGYFYLDLYPRPGKYDHFCVDSLRTGREQVDGGYEVPVCVMLANFPRPTGDRPSLFDHEEVTTFFHEFGHAMHCICSRAKYSMFSGMHVEDDFVEAPSQMLENWVWQPETLALMSGHYRTGEPIPAALLDALVRSRNANCGISNLRQVALATFDQHIFSHAQSNTAQVFAQVYSDVCGIDVLPGTNFAASFGHMAGGYDANYYGYLWSEVYSVDMFETRFRGQVLSSEVGMQYRRCILQPGSTVDAVDMLHNFLGRPPTNEAFLRSKGLSV